MSFASPAVLWGLPLAAAPLVLHLISRRRAARLPFSDLTFLRRVHAQALPRARLRQWLLAATRSALLALLVLAFSGPSVRRASGAAHGEEEGLDLSLWIDVSYSMGLREGGKTRLELALPQVEKTLKSLKPSDRVAVGLFSDRLESPAPAWGTANDALASAARARPGFRGTDYAVALKGASELFAASARRRKVALLVTDGAAHGRRGDRGTLDPEATWLGTSWPSAENGYVVEARPARQSGAAAPLLSVRTAGGAGRALELWDANKRLGTAPAKPALELSLPPAKGPDDADFSGRVELQHDALSVDDAYYFSFRHAARPRILCLFGDPDFFKAPQAGYFLKELFGGARESLLPYDADFLELSRFQEAKLGEYRAVILADFKEVPAKAAADLEGFVRRGGGLWVLPGGGVTQDSLAGLAGWLPARFGPEVNGEGQGLRVGAAAAPRLWAQFDLSKVAVTRYFLLQARPGAATWFRSPSGYPLLVSAPHGGGRCAVWALGLDGGWSNLAVKPAFPALAQTLLEALLGAASPRSEIFEVKVDEPFARTWREGEAAPPSVRVASPEGRQTEIFLKDRRAEFGQTARPGLYEMTETGGSGRRTVFAVNLDRSTGESDLAPLEPLPWRPLRHDRLVEDFESEVYGRDARPWTLALAAFLLALEMALSAPRPQGKSRRPPLTRSVAVAVLALVFLMPRTTAAQQGDRFLWAQLQLGPQWDPYPGVPLDVLEMLSTVTSVLTGPERRVLTLKDPLLFSSPMVFLAGRQAPAPLDAEELRRLRDYLTAGGTLWIEDTSGAVASSFDRWVRSTLKAALPEAELSPLPPDHVIYRSFFLLRGPAGRVMTRGSVEGLSWAGRAAVIYSRNDVLGAWAKDELGKPLLPCVPGGEAQRHNARKFAINVILYALTGSYKADAVHQPYLLQKMRSGIP